MSIDKNTIKKIARLARIELKERDIEPLNNALNRILSFVAQLDELDTENVEPMISVVEATNALRKDEITDGNYVADILTNAPEADHGFFMVPKVIE